MGAEKACDSKSSEQFWHHFPHGELRATTSLEDSSMANQSLEDHLSFNHIKRLSSQGAVAEARNGLN